MKLALSEISEYAFSYSNVKEIELPNFINKIRYSAFAFSKIKKVIIPLSKMQNLFQVDAFSL